MVASPDLGPAGVEAWDQGLCRKLIVNQRCLPRQHDGMGRAGTLDACLDSVVK